MTWLFFSARFQEGGVIVGRRIASQELLLLGERIRSRRIKLCLSQEALAEKAEISANTVSRIEGGQMSMGIGIFLKLVVALETDANSLLGIAPEPEERQCRNITSGISCLGEAEQEIVFRTVETLADALRKRR